MGRKLGTYLEELKQRFYRSLIQVKEDKKGDGGTRFSRSIRRI